MTYRAYFYCSNRCCEDQHELFQVMYRCPKCNGLLEVGHDLGPIKKKSAEEWKKLFDGRVGRTS